MSMSITGYNSKVKPAEQRIISMIEGWIKDYIGGGHTITVLRSDGKEMFYPYDATVVSFSLGHKTINIDIETTSLFNQTNKYWVKSIYDMKPYWGLVRHPIRKIDKVLTDKIDGTESYVGKKNADIIAKFSPNEQSFYCLPNIPWFKENGVWKEQKTIADPVNRKREVITVIGDLNGQFLKQTKRTTQKLIVDDKEALCKYLVENIT